jgi:hypothetical protein
MHRFDANTTREALVFKAVDTAREDLAAAILVYEQVTKTTNHDKGI